MGADLRALVNEAALHSVSRCFHELETAQRALEATAAAKVPADEPTVPLEAADGSSGSQAGTRTTETEQLGAVSPGAAASAEADPDEAQPTSSSLEPLPASAVATSLQDRTRVSDSLRARAKPFSEESLQHLKVSMVDFEVALTR